MTNPSWRKPLASTTGEPITPVVAKPCPVCGGERVAAIDSRVIDPLRLSHADGCRIGRAEDSTRDADAHNPLASYWRWSTAAEVELLEAFEFRADDGAVPVLAVLHPETRELVNPPAERPYLAVTLVDYPVSGVGVRVRTFPNLTETTE